jgi:hypothetical protein
VQILRQKLLCGDEVKFPSQPQSGLKSHVKLVSYVTYLPPSYISDCGFLLG